MLSSKNSRFDNEQRKDIIEALKIDPQFTIDLMNQKDANGNAKFSSQQIKSIVKVSKTYPELVAEYLTLK